VHFDTALNLAWGLLGLLALVRTIRASFGRAASHNRAPAWLHIVGVALIVAALFPYISATDDVIRIDHFSTQQDHHHPAKKHSNDNLIRLYETMDSPVISPVVVLAFALFFISLVIVPVNALLDRRVRFETGRSPPPAAC
jgi:hypothetical protein